MMMKALLAAVLFCVPIPVLAAQPTLISVTGQGRATAAPDMATMSLTITTNASNATAATSDNNAIFAQLEQRMHALGVAEHDIRTTYYNVTYNPRPEGVPAPNYGVQYGYVVSRGVSVTLQRTGVVGKAVDAAIAAGVNHVDGVSFGVSDNHALSLKALGDAVTQARSRAQAIATAAGLRIVRIRSIQEGYAQVYPQPQAMAMSRLAGVPTQIEPSDVSMQASVTVTYEAQP
ncbi:MAG TPA: SIMPL domain-containing protein [Candidatus Rubrimentiphilum sp.]|nr:SIMPL domain-containing protein [Candidatus Rubrimentiphilum sp.]